MLVALSILNFPDIASATLLQALTLSGLVFTELAMELIALTRAYLALKGKIS